MANRPKFFKEKLQEKIKDYVNSYFRKEAVTKSMKLFSCTKVELSSDLGYAKIYWDTFETSSKDDIDTKVKEEKNNVRAFLAKNLEIRHTPRLEFIYDAQFEAAMNIENLLQSNESED